MSAMHSTLLRAWDVQPRLDHAVREWKSSGKNANLARVQGVLRDLYAFLDDA